MRQRIWWLGDSLWGLRLAWNRDASAWLSTSVGDFERERLLHADAGLPVHRDGARWLLQLRWAPHLRAVRLTVGLGAWVTVGWGRYDDCDHAGLRLDCHGLHHVRDLEHEPVGPAGLTLALVALANLGLVLAALGAS